MQKFHAVKLSGASNLWKFHAVNKVSFWISIYRWIEFPKMAGHSLHCHIMLFVIVRDPERLPIAHRVYPRMEPDSSQMRDRRPYEQQPSYGMRERSRSPHERRDRARPVSPEPGRQQQYMQKDRYAPPIMSQFDKKREEQQREAARIADIFQVCTLRAHPKILTFKHTNKTVGVHGYQNQML